MYWTCGRGDHMQDHLEEAEIVTYTAQPLPKPSSMSMMTEDHEEHYLHKLTRNESLPTTVSESNEATTRSSTADHHKGRSLNFSLHDHSKDNQLMGKSSGKTFDLSDVSMDDEDDQMEIMPKNPEKVKVGTFCTLNGLTYDNGEKLENGCDSICTCTNGKMSCTGRCLTPLVKKGAKENDPMCVEKPVDDPCCASLMCDKDKVSHSQKTCTYKSRMYQKGERIEDGCDSLCTCHSAGNVTCEPRCKGVGKNSDHCVEVPDPADHCCKKVLCDVTLNDHEPEKDVDEPKIKIIAVKPINSTTIKIDFEPDSRKNYSTIAVEGSLNKSVWIPLQLSTNGMANAKNSKYIRLKNHNDIFEIPNTLNCEYKGHNLKLNEEYNDNCTSLCVCRESGVQCLTMECPTYFGVDVINPNCIEWESEPPNFVPSPPDCCPKSVVCKNNGSCLYKGEMYNNWQQVPTNITGCEKRCYCEMGNVECQNVCPPVPALPPHNLGCPPQLAQLTHLPDDDCCMYWTCGRGDHMQGINNGQIFPGGYYNVPPGFQQPQDEVNIHTLEAVDAHTIRLGFSVPSIIVGLHGRIDIRYTSKDNNDPNTWQSQVFSPPNDLIETAQLEVDLTGLKEDTEYKLKIIVTLRDLHNTPSSRVYTVRTLQDAPPTLPPSIPIEPNLVVTDVNSTWVNIAWRKFSDKELQFVDGVQIRYREIDGKIYAATPLIHRAVTSYMLENLKPTTKYEAGIFFIPFPGQLTELHSENMIHFTTANELDSYGFNVTLEVGLVKSTSVEITWSGVPYPEDKYVNIYRAIYQSDSGKGDFSTFKMAKRDSPPKATIMDLKPGIRYRLWLEIYLTNGRIKTSNVQDFVTKPRSAPTLSASTQQGKLESEELSPHKGDYYGPLVIVAILAAIAIISTLILLLILVKRHNQNKAAITSPPRVTQSAYDNPTYKVEIQQETMNL
ncbi:putative epidermal cell surface receptor isoform X2 [Photinus pyralis]|uniref:putative epidermal cell surface receptor isoform X2 n=1 Tax=Photinus pyralis TaxID=7054 RepID=UPI001267018F|nr:putative epidermal cell surface receptor isoform X2 [Photinus pyralis]